MKGTWSAFRLADGRMPGVTVTCESGRLAAYTPEGCGWVAGAHDHLSLPVDLAALQVVDYRPPMPPDTDLLAHAWDDGSRRWVANPTLKALKAERAWPVLQALERLEEPQPRAAREILIALGLGQPLPPEAKQRIAEIEAAAVGLRSALAAIEGARDAEELRQLPLVP